MELKILVSGSNDELIGGDLRVLVLGATDILVCL